MGVRIGEIVTNEVQTCDIRAPREFNLLFDRVGFNVQKFMQEKKVKNNLMCFPFYDLYMCAYFLLLFDVKLFTLIFFFVFINFYQSFYIHCSFFFLHILKASKVYEAVAVSTSSLVRGKGRLNYNTIHSNKILNYANYALNTHIHYVYSYYFKKTS